MHIYAKQFFVGSALLFMLFLTHKEASAELLPPPKTKAELKADVKKGADDVIKLIKLVENFGCYWDSNLGSGVCAFHIPTCAKMVLDRKKFTKQQYHETIAQFKELTDNTVSKLDKEIDTSTKTPVQLTASITQELLGLHNGVKNNISGLFNTFLKPLREDYKVLHNTSFCPKK